MTTTNVQFLIDAEDLASSKLRQVTENIEKQVKQVRAVGGQAKASSEFVGTLANAMGGSQFGMFAGQVAQITERVSAFSEVSKAGGAGALAFKAGLVAVTGVIAFQVGKALGDILFQTAKWNEQLKQSHILMESLSSRVLGNLGKSFERERERIGLLIDPAEQAAGMEELNRTINLGLTSAVRAVEVQKKKIEDLTSSFAGAGAIINAKFIENEEQGLKVAEARLEALRNQRDTLADANSEYTKQLDLMREEKTLFEASAKYVDKLAEEVELLKMSNEERTKYEAAKQTTDADEGRAVALLAERDALLAIAKAEQDAEAARKKALQDETAAQQKIIDLRKSTVDQFTLQIEALKNGEQAAAAMRFEMQGLDAETAKGFAEIDAMIKKINEKKEPGSSAATSLTSQDQRLLSGRGESAQSKLVESTKTLVDNSKETNKLLTKATELLDKLSDKESVTLETVGD